MTVRVYKLADRNLIVHAVGPETTLYDVVFTKHDPRDLQMLADMGLPPETPRNPARWLTTDTLKLAHRLAIHGHYLRSDRVDARKVIRCGLEATGYRFA